MDLIIGIVIGIMYGRNVHAINARVYEDVSKLYRAFSKTGFAANLYYIIEGLYLAFEKKYIHKDAYYTHDLLCTCNRRTCKPVSINTYVRKLKAIQ